MTIGTPETEKFFSQDAARTGLENAIRARAAISDFIESIQLLVKVYRLLPR
ncbi:Hypothetical protein AT6N2_L0058 [Agrobacterium tumefaciens]|nr:Hypothetical protein AT6N2_L0058 [Agrobacterium tumefaciens]